MDPIRPGDTYEHRFRFSQDQVVHFADVTGDHNAVHLDADYASQTRFGRPIIHGFLAGSVFSKVFGTLFPGEGTIYLRQEMDFRRPMFVEEDYVARFEVREVKPDKHIGVIDCTIQNAADKTCLSGTAVLLHAERF